MTIKEAIGKLARHLIKPESVECSEPSILGSDKIFEQTRAYVEKTFSEAYKREIDQDETVWRTVPFFVATMSAFSALLYYCFSQLPAFSQNFWVVCGYLLSAIASAFAFVAFCYLTYAVFPRKYQKIPVESEILKFVRDTQDCANEQNLSDEDKDLFALIDIHNMMIEEFAAAVSRNRKNNKKRYTGRAGAAICICSAIICTIPLSIGIAVSQKIHPERRNVGAATQVTPQIHTAAVADAAPSANQGE